jgi:hypothetical protein
MLTLELSKWLPVPAGTWKDIKASPSVFYICLAGLFYLASLFSTTLGMAWYPLLLSRAAYLEDWMYSVWNSLESDLGL